MPRPRLQRAATARREKVQLRIREQCFFYSAYDTKHTNLKNTLKEMEDKNSKMHTLVEDNNLKLQKHVNSLEKIEAVLQDHAKNKDAMTEGFLNHRDSLRAMQSKLTSNDDVFYLFLQKQNLGAKLHIYL